MELLVVIAATAILSALVSIPLSTLQTQQGLNSAVNTTVTTLRRAQTQAMAGMYATTWNLHLSNGNGCALPSNNIWIYQGNDFAAVSTSDLTDKYSLPAGSKISAISIGGGCDVSFARYSGSTTTTGTITLVDQNNTSKTISINSYGRISPP